MNDKLTAWLSEETEKRNWSHRELARRAGISQTAVSTVIAGQRKAGWDFCAAIAKALNESPLKVFQLAGLLPPTPLSEESPILRELWNLVQDMPEAEREEILKYARFRHQQSQEE
jgi:transcriptional regulator with XRE-family HTH domain